MQARLFIAVLAAALSSAIMSAPAAASDAQTLRRASQDIYATCFVGDPVGANPASCACAAGFIGGALTDRDYDIVARLGRIGVMEDAGATQEEIAAEINAYLAAGYTVEDGQAAAAKLDAASARGDAICAPYHENATS